MTTTAFRPFPRCLLAAATAMMALATPLLDRRCPAQDAHTGIVVPHPRPGPQPPGPAVETGLMLVMTSIHDGAATTTIRQTLRNRTGAQQEAWWMLPVPAGSLADRFTLTVGGTEMPGEILDADKARRVYEEIVRRRRDPGLLEYMGLGCLRARVFPIPPHGEVQVSVRYTEMLQPSDGVTTFRYPLRAAWTDGRGPDKLGFRIDVECSKPIKTVWSPLADLEVTRDGEHRLKASAEFTRDQLPGRDLALHFGLADQDFGASVLSYRRAGEPGYFVVWLAPKRDWPEDQTLVRSVNLVLDTSGSMAGEKIEQARGAVRTFLLSLRPGDWFNVIPFSTEARPFFDAPVPADAEHREQALAMVDRIAARGGTNIEDAMRTALRTARPQQHPTAVPITVFLTDGLPTVGTTDVDALLRQTRQDNEQRSRIFVFGVGHDVNTRLLDTLASDSRGDRDYVQPGEDIERKTGSLFAKLSGPVMTDVSLQFDGLEAFGTEPARLPDMFVQGQLTVVGRFHGEGQKAIRLRGRVGDTVREYVFEATFPAADTKNDWLPSLWAQHKVATLLDAIRMQGGPGGADQELVAEVRRLGREYGIVTPFTSHLVVEEGMQVAAARGVQPGGPAGVWADQLTVERLQRELRRAGRADLADRAGADLDEVQAEAKKEAERSIETLAATPETGAPAVAQSLILRVMASDRDFEADGAVAVMHRRIANRNFHLVQGVWVDGAIKGRPDATPRRIEAFSDDYFALLRLHPELAPALAFSTRVVLCLPDEVVEITAG